MNKELHSDYWFPSSGENSVWSTDDDDYSRILLVNHDVAESLRKTTRDSSSNIGKSIAKTGFCPSGKALKSLCCLVGCEIDFLDCIRLGENYK